MIWLIIIPFALYVITIGALYIGSILEKEFVPKLSTPITRFSVIIPFRNEADNLLNLLSSLNSLTYPTALFEIILVNDASTDNSERIVLDFIKKHATNHIRLIDNQIKSSSPKKDALQTAIHLASGDWIVTTDADCIVQPSWLDVLDHFIRAKNCQLVVMPVAIAISEKRSFFKAYEQLDFLSLMGATVGGFGLKLPFLCNGANLAFDKEHFLKLNGYDAHNHIASGDDHFLLEQMASRKDANIQYLKSSLVITTTQPQKSWTGFINQRIRWAKKATHYSFWFSKYIGLLVLVVNALWVFLFSYLIFTLFDNFLLKTGVYHYALLIILPLLIVKLIIDAQLILKEAAFYKRWRYIAYLPLVSIFYPFISTYIALNALMVGFEWKGRNYRR
ncbi:glycosyltransferase [Dokdonia sp. Hel_I_53]|uniref:glycosyltransferase n=1 Tax=Dokdonia sp. Hel_I_53 TaxID=1566287 RepID=UPI00119BFEF4|nr:glycosyltransferase [Dokdonia sp. Hel_I_53]TVZ52881.1 cellulose synthase/poly-beta-1,6-N-acetylglucosamine synthase-like glycosyltransferase [Dokdonia sp. Hel_I_53]